MSAAAAWPCPLWGLLAVGLLPRRCQAVPLHTLLVPLTLSFPLGALYHVGESHSPS